MTENLKNHTLFRGTYLYSPYMGVPPPRELYERDRFRCKSHSSFKPRSHSGFRVRQILQFITSWWGGVKYVNSIKKKLKNGKNMYIWIKSIKDQVTVNLGTHLRRPLTKVQVPGGGRLFVCKFSAVHKDDFSDRQLFKLYHRRRTYS